MMVASATALGAVATLVATTLQPAAALDNGLALTREPATPLSPLFDRGFLLSASFCHHDSPTIPLASDCC